MCIARTYESRYCRTLHPLSFVLVRSFSSMVLFFSCFSFNFVKPFFSSFLILRPFRSSFTCLFSIEAWKKAKYQRKKKQFSLSLLLILPCYCYRYWLDYMCMAAYTKNELFVIYIFAKVYPTYSNSWELQAVSAHFVSSRSCLHSMCVWAHSRLVVITIGVLNFFSSHLFSMCIIHVDHIIFR